MNRSEAGVTLVELLVAGLIVTLALIPLLQLVPGTLAPVQVSDLQLRLGAAATRKAEELITVLRDDINGATSGAAACPDVPGCRLEWMIATETSSVVQGVGSLKTVATTACQDRDSSGICDAGEEQVRYDTKITSRP